MKICQVCKIEKDTTEFGKRGSGKIRNECKMCRIKYLREYRRGNKNKEFTIKKGIKPDKKICSSCDKEKKIEEFIHQKRICKLCKKEYLKKYNIKNKEKISNNQKMKYLLSPDEKKRYSKEYSKNNRRKINATRKIYKREVLEKDPIWNLKLRYSSRIRKYLKLIGMEKDFKSKDILGCSMQEFKKHIEDNFVEGMNWENRSLWHLDHTIPISIAKTEEELKILSHYKNIIPMWSSENIIKSNKFDSGNPTYKEILKLRKKDSPDL